MFPTMTMCTQQRTLRTGLRACRDTAPGGISLSSTPTPYCACTNVILLYRTTFLWQQQQQQHIKFSYPNLPLYLE